MKQSRALMSSRFGMPAEAGARVSDRVDEFVDISVSTSRSMESTSSEALNSTALPFASPAWRPSAPRLPIPKMAVAVGNHTATSDCPWPCNRRPGMDPRDALTGAVDGAGRIGSDQIALRRHRLVDDFKLAGPPGNGNPAPPDRLTKMKCERSDLSSLAYFHPVVRTFVWALVLLSFVAHPPLGWFGRT